MHSRSDGGLCIAVGRSGLSACGCAAGDDRDGSGLAQRAAQAVRVLAFVAEQVAHPAGASSAGAAFTSLTLPEVSISA